MDERAAARHQELLDRVRDAIPGEPVVDAAWVARTQGRRSIGEVTRAELNPVQVLRDLPWAAIDPDASTGKDVSWYMDATNGVLGGPPESLAARLRATLPDLIHPVAMVITPHRLLFFQQEPEVQPGTPWSLGRARRIATRAAREIRDIVVNAQSELPPIRRLRLLWEAPRHLLVRLDPLPANGDMALLMNDRSWVVLTAANAETTARLRRSAFPH